MKLASLLPVLPLLLAGVRADVMPSAGFGSAREIALLENQEIAEASGLSASTIDDDRIWLINDSGNPATLYAVNRQGRTLSESRLRGVERNVDWEALDTFELDGRHFLLIGDVGDNLAVRSHVSLFLVEEPDDLPVPSLDILRTIEVRLADGAADIESLFVDPVERRVFLLTKREFPTRIWTLPLSVDGPDEALVASLVGELDSIPRPTDADLAEDPRLGKYRGQPTDISMRPDRSGVAVLTYGDAYWYARTPDQTWADALAGAPKRIELPRLAQAEGIAFSRSGASLLVTSERLPAPLIELTSPAR